MYRILLTLSMVALTASFAMAQTFDHNTGTLQVTVFETGYLGHDAATVPGGNGVIFNGNGDACFTSGVMYGNALNGVPM